VFVDLAGNGEEAIRMIERNEYDVVLMDMQMPVMDGVAATRILRSDSRFVDLPIVAMTANALASDRELCLAVGMNDHIAKPIDPYQMFGVLLRWLRKESADGDGHAMADGRQQRGKHLDLDLPGIDTNLGLRRTGGNPDRYAALLRKLATTQVGAVDNIRFALVTGDDATAERAAHSLKGAAGTLGATALAEAAAGAESAIKAGSGIDEAVSALAAVLDPVIEGITQALPDDAATNGKGARAADPSTVVEPLARLKRLLEADDGEAADFVVDVKPRLAGVLTPLEVKMLSDRVGNFEFDAALKCLSGIAARLSLDLEGK
jgi:CheY-like chemotaxis protein